MFDTRTRKRGKYTGGLIVSLIAVAIASLLVTNRQAVVDQISVWQYQPSSGISAMVDRTQMTNEATRYFYASRPAIQDSTSFNKSCGQREQGIAVLGCYTGSQIFIYDVADKRLDGIREVTAAHEMLHAAYDRLSVSKRQRVDQLLEAEYAALKGDSSFADRMAFYARTEPGERDNELHSVIGTEVATLNPELEAYYQQYFTQRSIVVGLHAEYATVFKGLQQRSKQLADEMDVLSARTAEQSTRYNQDVATLNADIADFNRRAGSGGFATQQQFQSERQLLTERASGLEVLRGQINDSVARYNALREELVSVSGQSEALNRSIDSTLAPAPSL